MALLRGVVLAAFGADPSPATLATSIVAGLPGQIAFGLLLAVPLAALARTPLRWAIHAATLLIVLANVAAFHYEAVFGRLPGAAVLYYVREARHLAASAGANAPLAAVVAEVAIVATLLVAVAERWARADSPPGRRGPRLAALACAAAVAVSIVVLAAPSLLPGRWIRASRVPLVWAAQSWWIQRDDPSAARLAWPERAARTREWQRVLGHREPFGGVDERHPLCGPGPRHPERAGNGRSVIFVVLESIGMAQMTTRHGEAAVMPNLQRIARENVLFPNLKASGNKSLQAMPALFAGLPPQPASNLLWRAPLNHLEGFPLLLRRSGYRTAYFHGGDLSFEQQRPFVRMAGFETIVEFDLEADHPFLGWGWPDDVVIGMVREWIEEHRAERAAEPYLATLFTLSTHDPYVLPPDHPRAFDGAGPQAALIEALHFADRQIGALYDWFLRVEAPRGTILVMTGDHTPHLGADGADDPARFDVPLIVAGHDLPPIDPAGAARRLGAQFDVPATVHGLIGTSPGACDQGIDLFLPAPEWPAGRTVYAVDGDQLESFQVWFPDGRVHLDLATRRAVVTPARGEAGNEEQAAFTDRALAFHRLTRAISADLIARDAFAPPSAETAAAPRPPHPRVERPRFVAHRGQSRGEVPPARQNKAATIERAIDDGFEWIEVDVNLTRDGMPVLIHDAEIAGPDGIEREVYSLTLDEIRAIPGWEDVLTLEEAFRLAGARAGLLVELKPQRTFYRNTVLTLRSAAVVREHATPARIVMDSFSPFIAASLVRHCGCPVGIDAPYGKPVTRALLENAVLTGTEWIYVHHGQASPALIRDAHALGLRVLVYTVDDLAEIARLAPEWPDAIITNRAALAEAFEARFGEEVRPSAPEPAPRAP